MKDLVELFAACGGDDAGGGYVTLPNDFSPIDIVLKVVPTHIDLDEKVVNFLVLIDNKIDMNEVGQIRQLEFNARIQLPIEAVQLAPKAEEDGVT